MVDVMDYINADIVTVNTGMAASMGSVLLGAGTKGKRFSLKHSRTMLHQSSGGFSGNIQDAEVDMEEWKKINDELFILLGKYCGKKPDQVKKDATRDFWLTADEAVKYGIIDQVVLKNASEDALNYWNAHRSSCLEQNLLLAHRMSFQLKLDRASNTLAEKIAAEDHSAFWCKEVDKFFQVHQSAGGVAVVILDRSENIISLETMFNYYCSLK
jgi:hypothetical protein